MNNTSEGIFVSSLQNDKPKSTKADLSSDKQLPFRRCRVVTRGNASTSFENDGATRGRATIPRIVVSFSPDGSPLEAHEYDSEGLLTYRIHYATDLESGQAIETRCSSDGTLVSRSESKLSWLGRLTEFIHLPMDRLAQTGNRYLEIEGPEVVCPANVCLIVLTYDARKRPVKAIFFSAGNSISGRLILTYDASGSLESTAYYENELFPLNGNAPAEFCMLYLTRVFLFAKCAVSRFLQGRIGKVLHCIFYGVPLLEVKFAYDNEGRKLIEDLYQLDFHQLRTCYEYDLAARSVSRAEYSSSGSLITQEVSSYK